MLLHKVTLALLLILPVGRALAQEPEQPLEQLRAEVIAVLGKFDPDPKNKETAEQQLRADLSKIIGRYSGKLRPDMGSKKHITADKAFVLVIAANGRNGGNGEAAAADDAQAKLVIAVSGDGSPALVGQLAGGGGSARAKAATGIALAVGGRGGDGRAGTGGGGGGGSDATGGVGSVGLGGSGGTAGDGRAGGAGACRIENPDAIVKAAKASQRK